MIKKVDHIGIAVHSIDAILPFYTEILKLKLVRIEEVKTQFVKVAFLDAGETKLELLEPTSPESVIAKYIKKSGQGIHHIALAVESISDRIVQLQENGIVWLINIEKRWGWCGNCLYPPNLIRQCFD